MSNQCFSMLRIYLPGCCRAKRQPADILRKCLQEARIASYLDEETKLGLLIQLRGRMEEFVPVNDKEAIIREVLMVFEKHYQCYLDEGDEPEWPWWCVQFLHAQLNAFFLQEALRNSRWELKKSDDGGYWRIVLREMCSDVDCEPR